MQKRRFSHAVLVALLGLMLAVAPHGVTALAREDYEFCLTVQGVGDGASAGVLSDLEHAQVTVDVYRLADAAYVAGNSDDGFASYRYDSWDESFASLQDEFDQLAAGRAASAERWQDLYDQAARIVASPSFSGTPAASGPLGPVMLDARGLYLVVAHGNDGTAFDEEYGAGTALGRQLRFSLPPTMFVAPTKYASDGSMSGPLYTDWAFGDWHDQASVILKSSYEPLFGSLQIDKAVDQYGGEETTFVFHVFDSATGGDVYDNYASITLVGTSHGSTTVEHIPVGLQVTVDEVYAGGRYQLEEAHNTATVVAEHLVGSTDGDGEVVSLACVDFTNAPSGDHPGGGHGIQNHFDFSQGSWPLVMTPEKPRLGDDEVGAL